MFPGPVGRNMVSGLLGAPVTPQLRFPDHTRSCTMSQGKHLNPVMYVRNSNSMFNVHLMSYAFADMRAGPTVTQQRVKSCARQSHEVECWPTACHKLLLLNPHMNLPVGQQRTSSCCPAQTRILLLASSVPTAAAAKPNIQKSNSRQYHDNSCWPTHTIMELLPIA